MSMKEVILYTDGACRNNPGPGGWGVVLFYQQHRKTLSGFELATTNNRMELTAAIQGLTSLKTACVVQLYTDSQYVKTGIEVWIAKWKKNNWRTAANKPIKNQDLWMQLDQLVSQHQVTWYWVRGHNGNLYNEEADELARTAIITGLLAMQDKDSQ